MSVYGGLQIGGGGAGTASEASFPITNLSRTDPDLESKRKAYVSHVTPTHKHIQLTAVQGVRTIEFILGLGSGQFSIHGLSEH